MSLTGLKSFPAPHCPPPKAQAPCLDLLPLWTPPFTTWSVMSCLQPQVPSCPECLHSLPLVRLPVLVPHSAQ